MFKFNAGRVEHRMATLIGFGFEEGNLVRMTQDDPIYFTGSQIRVAGAHFCIFYAGTGPDTFQTRFEKVVDQLSVMPGFKKPDESIQVIHNTDDHYFIAPLSLGDEVIYAIGLTEQCMDNMRKGHAVSYRMRLVEGEGDNYEVMMFWGPSAEMMEAQFADLIGPETEKLPR